MYPENLTTLNSKWHILLENKSSRTKITTVSDPSGWVNNDSFM